MLAQVLIAEADAFVVQWKDLKLPDGATASCVTVLDRSAPSRPELGLSTRIEPRRMGRSRSFLRLTSLQTLGIEIEIWTLRLLIRLE
jgi:hypothetical protein